MGPTLQQQFILDCQNGDELKVASLLNPSILDRTLNFFSEKSEKIDINKADSIELSTGPDVHWSVTLTPLAAACRSGKPKIVQLLLNQPSININPPWDDSHPLLWASKLGRVEVVELLLQQPALKLDASFFFNHLFDPDSKPTDELKFKIMQLVFQYHPECVNTVMQESKRTLLGEAIYKGYNKVVNLLLAQPGINVNQYFYSNGKQTALSLVCFEYTGSEQQRQVITSLLRHPRIDINFPYKSVDIERTPLEFLWDKQDTSIIKLFLATPVIKHSLKSMYAAASSEDPKKPNLELAPYLFAACISFSNKSLETLDYEQTKKCVINNTNPSWFQAGLAPLLTEYNNKQSLITLKEKVGELKELRQKTFNRWDNRGIILTYLFLVMLTDEYFQLAPLPKEDSSGIQPLKKMQRFFKIGGQLPQELQQMLSHITYESSKILIPAGKVNAYLKQPQARQELRL